MNKKTQEINKRGEAAMERKTWNLYGCKKRFDHPYSNLEDKSDEKDLIFIFDTEGEVKEYVEKSRMKFQLPGTAFWTFKSHSALRYYSECLVTNEVLNEGEEPKGEELLEAYRISRSKSAKRTREMYPR